MCRSETSERDGDRLSPRKYMQWVEETMRSNLDQEKSDSERSTFMFIAA